MTQILPRLVTLLAGPARLLVIALVPLVAFMAMAHTTVVGDAASDMTAAQVDERALPWITVAVLWILPIALAAVAFTAIAARLGRGSAVKPLAVLGVVLLMAYVVAQACVVWIDSAAALADSSWLAAAILLSLLGWWSVDVAAVLTCRHLFKHKVAPRTALVIGILTAAFLLLEIAIYLPALVGGQELQDTVGLPPMLLPALWAILGGVLWRQSAQANR
ncbi:hypothetical protein [Kribbella sp. C-35]|uniref:hypothetical protein n=1 Tax=Kribbella sp. C-35 TaxID=2789276 RepID=UPI003979E198